MTDTAALSVITPVYKPSGFEALAVSLANNCDLATEWIVVDDGSGPEFDNVFESLPETVSVIRRPKNKRQGAARNAGLAAAKGDWIKFLDADDILDQGHLTALLEAVQTLPKTAIPFAPTKHVFAGGQTTVNTSFRDLPAEPQAQFLRQLVRPFLHHCGALYPRQLLQRLGGYDESLITDEDGDLLLRILQAGYHFEPVEGVHYEYIHHTTGPRVSTDDSIAKMHARIKTCDKIEAGFAGKMPGDVATALAQRMDKIALTYWTAFPKEARALLQRAEKIAPGYQPDLRRSLQFVRKLGGPGATLAAQAVFRMLKGRPKGGAQG